MRTVVNWRRRFLCVSDFLSRKVGCGSDGGGSNRPPSHRSSAEERWDGGRFEPPPSDPHPTFLLRKSLTHKKRRRQFTTVRIPYPHRPPPKHEY